MTSEFYLCNLDRKEYIKLKDASQNWASFARGNYFLSFANFLTSTWRGNRIDVLRDIEEDGYYSNWKAIPITIEHDIQYVVLYIKKTTCEVECECFEIKEDALQYMNRLAGEYLKTGDLVKGVFEELPLFEVYKNNQIIVEIQLRKKELK